MTVPIIPGPFSFLAGAGEAAGRIGESLQARRQRKMAEAQAGFSNVLALVNAGRLDPSVLNSPEVQGLLKVANIPLPAAQIPQSLRDVGRAEVVATPEPFQPTAEDVLRQRKARALATLAPGGAAERQVTQVPSEEVAGAGERKEVAGAKAAEAAATVAGEQARVAPAQADLEISKARTQQRVFEGALETLGDPKDPLFRRLAQEAALGILPVRLQRMEQARLNLSLERQAMADYARLLIGSLHDINTTFKSLHDAWSDGLRQAITAGELQQRKREEVVAEYIRDFGAEPSYEEVRGDYLKSNLGLTIDEYHKQIKGVLPLLKGEGEERKPQPTAAQSSKIGRAVTLILQNPTADRIRQLGEAAAAGQYASGHLTAIRAQLQGKVKPDVLKALGELIDQIIAREEGKQQ